MPKYTATFNVKLNEKNFRDGEELKINIELNKPIYLTIFQILPYEKKDFQVHKVFPNELEKIFSEKSYIRKARSPAKTQGRC